MREILFRAKAMSENEWVYGSLIHYNRNPRTEKWTIREEGGLEHDIDEETVGQYTGVCDSSGVKVWEGDIIGHVSLESDDDEVSVFGVVRWTTEGNFCINTCQCRKYNSDDVYANVGYMMPSHKSLRVMGNIYDNPELLKL